MEIGTKLGFSGWNKISVRESYKFTSVKDHKFKVSNVKEIWFDEEESTVDLRLQKNED